MSNIPGRFEKHPVYLSQLKTYLTKICFWLYFFERWMALPSLKMNELFPGSDVTEPDACDVVQNIDHMRQVETKP